MKEFINKPLSTIADYQKQLIKEATQRAKSGQDFSAKEFLARIQNVPGVKKLSAVVEQTGDIFTSESLKRLYEGLALDLYSLYNEANDIDKLGSALERHIVSSFGTIRSKVDEQLNRFQRLVFLKQRKWMYDVYIDNFSSNKNDSLADHVTSIDTKSGVARLPVKSSKLIRVDPASDIVIKKMVVGASSEYTAPGFGPEMASDKSELSAWHTMGYFNQLQSIQYNLTTDDIVVGSNLMTTDVTQKGDRKIYIAEAKTIPKNSKIQIGGRSYFDEFKVISHFDGGVNVSVGASREWPSGTPVGVTSEAEISSGALCFYEITLPYEDIISSIGFKPFAEFPLKIVGVTHKVSNNEWAVIPIAEQRTTLDPTVVNFDPVISRVFRIIIEQPTATWIHEVFSEQEIVNSSDMEASFERALNKQSRIIQSRSSTIKELSSLKGAIESYGKSIVKNYRAQRSSDTMYDRLSDFIVPIGSEVGSRDDGVADIIQGISPTRVIDKTGKSELKVYGYSFGAAEIEFYRNEYFQSSEYLSEELDYGVDLDVAIAYCDESHPKNAFGDLTTSIEYSVVMVDGVEVPVPNLKYKNSSGGTLVEDEYIELDYFGATAVGWLRLPVITGSSIKVYEINPLRPKTLYQKFNVVNISGGKSKIIIFDPNINSVYVATYNAQVTGADIKSHGYVRAVSPYIDIETDDDLMVHLDLTPNISKLIVNNSNTWRKNDKFDGVWEFMGTDFTVINNIYYGYGETNKITKSPAMDQKLEQMFLSNGEDVKSLSDRFYNKYGGTTPEKNLFYEPIIVEVDGQKAYNISNYRSSNLQSFATSEDREHQYYQLGNVLVFNSAVKARASFQYIDSRIRFKALHRCNRKSNIVLSPEVSTMRFGVSRIVL